MRIPVTLLAASLVLTGCASGPASEAPATPNEVRFASGSIEVGASTSPPETHDARLEATRIDDGRVVLTFAGDGTVNYVGWYVEQARTYDTGESIDVPGASILQLDLISSATTSGTEEMTEPIADGDVSVQVTASQSGVVQVFVGVAADRPEFAVDAVPGELTLVFS